jgi:hypothetical protein
VKQYGGLDQGTVALSTHSSLMRLATAEEKEQVSTDHPGSMFLFSIFSATAEPGSKLQHEI